MHLSHTLIASGALFYTISTGSPIGESSLSKVSKRADKPPIPSVAELKAHLHVPAPDTCMFFTGFTAEAASEYADANGKHVLADLDDDFWAAEDETTGDYASDCPLSFDFQEPHFATGTQWGDAEIASYWDNMSAAFTEICSGVILLGIPPSADIPSDSVFARIEWPIIRAAGGSITRVDAIKLGTGEADGTPLSAPTTIWTRCATS